MDTSYEIKRAEVLYSQPCSPHQEPQTPSVAGHETHTPQPNTCAEHVRLMVKLERECQPRPDYLTTTLLTFSSEVRTAVIGWIEKVVRHRNLPDTTLFLAVNFLDRFMCLYPLQESERWVVQLAAVACLFLAARMEQDHPCTDPAHLQVFTPWQAEFEPQQITRMGNVVLATLTWKTQPVTAAAMLHGCTQLLQLRLPKSLAPRDVQCCSMWSKELLRATLPVPRYLSFLPSTMAVAALLISVHNTHCEAMEDVSEVFAEFVDDEVLQQCCAAMQQDCFKVILDMKADSRRSSGGGSEHEERSANSFFYLPSPSSDTAVCPSPVEQAKLSPSPVEQPKS